MLAKLPNEVVLVGVQDHLKIGAMERWQTYVTGKQAHDHDIAETALGGSLSHV
jgi:DNA-binding transcriptional regulator/RsmH inhibitor MraZ